MAQHQITTHLDKNDSYKLERRDRRRNHTKDKRQQRSRRQRQRTRAGIDTYRVWDDGEYGPDGTPEAREFEGYDLWLDTLPQAVGDEPRKPSGPASEDTLRDLILRAPFVMHPDGTVAFPE